MQQEPENLPRDLTQCHALIRELLEKLRHLEALTEKQKHQLAQLLRYRYGQRADRIHADQLVLWALEELGSPPAEKPEEQNRAGKAQQRGHGRKALPKDLPRKRVEHEAPEKERICRQCGCPKERIGQEVSEQLEYIPASFYVLEHVCPKYACRVCEGELVRASKPMQPIEKGLPGPGLLAHVITSKYSDHLPLYRLEGIFGRHGLQIARSTMCDWMAACADLVSPLYELMHTRILASKVIHTDDTPVSVLDKTLTKTRTGRIWVYIGDKTAPYTVFHYTPTRSRDGPVEFLKDFSGYLQADAYGGYDGMYRQGKIREVACWAHTRRKFVDAESTHPARALIAVSWIRRLYAIEHQGLGMNVDDRWRLRQQKATPALQQFRQWLSQTLAEVLPKSPLGEAIGYALSNWEALTRYLEDADLAIDNNVAERALRATVVGRNNWLFFGSDKGGQTAAVLSSFTATCKAHGIDPFMYLRDVLGRICAHPAKHLEEFLPDRWLACQAPPTQLPASAA